MARVLAQHRRICAESHKAVPRPGLKSCMCQQAQHLAGHFRCPLLPHSLTWVKFISWLSTGEDTEGGPGGRSMGQGWEDYAREGVPLEMAHCQHLVRDPGPTTPRAHDPRPQVKGGSYLGEHKAVVVGVPGVLGLVAHGVEKEDSHDLCGAAARRGVAVAQKRRTGTLWPSIPGLQGSP